MKTYNLQRVLKSYIIFYTKNHNKNNKKYLSILSSRKKKSNIFWNIKRLINNEAREKTWGDEDYNKRGIKKKRI